MRVQELTAKATAVSGAYAKTQRNTKSQVFILRFNLITPNHLPKSPSNKKATVETAAVLTYEKTPKNHLPNMKN